MASNPSSLSVWRPLALVVLVLSFAVAPVIGETDAVVEKVSVATVAWLTLAMAGATGLGSVPFFFVQLESRWSGICNGVASGVMLAASFELIEEGQKYGEGSAVVFGIIFGGVFIFLSQRFVHNHFGEVSMLDVKGADVPKMILVVSIMTLHSFGEGSGVGVSFAGPRGFSQGLMVTIAIAVHNIPEGLAVSLLLSNQGLSPRRSLLWSIFTSLPQPLVAVPAFICAEAFHRFLPFCMGFAGGCMIWMVMAEVLPDSFKDADSKEVAAAGTLAVTFMVGLSALLDDRGGAPSSSVSLLLAYQTFGVGPIVGALIHMVLLNVVKLPVTMATGVGGGVALVLAAWKPLQMLVDGRMIVLHIVLLLCAGAVLHYLLRKYVEAKTEGSPMVRRASLAAFMVWVYTSLEGLAMGVAAANEFRFSVAFPVALHGLPRGVGVGSIVYGATGSVKGSSLAAALTCFAGPAGGIAAGLTGAGATGLESLLVVSCGSLFPILTGVLFGRALKVDPKGTYFGISVGVVLTVMCLVSTRLVCLHTPYCGLNSL